MLEGFASVIDSVARIGTIVLVICLLFLGLFISLVIIVIRAIWRYLRTHSSKWFGGYNYDYRGKYNEFKSKYNKGTSNEDTFHWKVDNDDIDNNN